MDPVSFVDPNGESLIIAGAIAVGTFIATTAYYYQTDYAFRRKIQEEMLKRRIEKINQELINDPTNRQCQPKSEGGRSNWRYR